MLSLTAANPGMDPARKCKQLSFLTLALDPSDLKNGFLQG